MDKLVYFHHNEESTQSLILHLPFRMVMHENTAIQSISLNANAGLFTLFPPHCGHNTICCPFFMKDSTFLY
ncbi:hypothetical protein N3930_42650, partial [Bacillus thuringiensis]|nr:hypothetical protein [Bacillus thuringiensis]